MEYLKLVDVRKMQHLCLIFFKIWYLGFIHLLFPNFGKLETFQIYFPIFGKIFFQFSNFWKNDFPKIGKQIGNFPIFQILEKADE